MGKPSAPPPPNPKATSAAQTGTSVSTAIANAVLQNPSQITPYGNMTISYGGSTDLPEIETFTVDGPGGGGTNPYSSGFGRDATPGIAALFGGGSRSSTRYRVGDNEFTTLEEAQAYRNSLDDSSYTWTDPYTGQTYTIPRMTIEQTLTDEQQQMLDNNNQAGINMSEIARDQSARIGELLNTPFSLDEFGERRNFDETQAPTMGRVGSGPQLQGSVNPTMSMTGSIAGAGPIQTGVQQQNYINSVPTQNLNTSFQGAGPIQASVPTQSGYTHNVQGGDIRTSLGDVGDIRSNVNLGNVSGGSIYSSFQMPDIQMSFDGSGAGEILRDANLPGIRDVSSGENIPGVNYNRSDLGEIQNSFDAGRDIQFETGDAGEITRTYGTDFSEDRQRVEDALMARMSPQLDQRREQLEARLASQGIRIGSEQYQDAMADYNRATNDAQLGAILGAGQEQSRLADLEARRAGFENAAQQQAFNQLRSTQDAYNSAQAQQFGQNATQAQFANAAQAQGAGQTLQQDQLDLQAQQANAETQRAYEALGINRDIAAGNQALQGAQFTNDAQQQAFNQLLSEAGYGLDAAALQGNLGLGADRNSIQAQTATANNQLQAGIANQQARLQEAQFQNAAQQQGFGQELAGAQFANQAQQQGFDQGAFNANLNNQTLNQLFANDLAAGQFANQAQAQQFGQNQAQAQFGNDALLNQFGMDLSAGQFANNAAAQQFQDLLAGGQFANQAQSQQFGQNAAQAQFQNDAAGQELQQLLAQAGFSNDAAQQQYQNQQDATLQNNAAAQQEFQNYLQGLQAENANRSAGIEEAFAERNQPINEIAALLSGSQVQNPNFTQANIPGIPTTDNAGIINDAYQAQMQNYQAELGNWNSMWGGILGLGAGFI